MRRRALATLMNKNKTGKRGTPRGCQRPSSGVCTHPGSAAGQGGPVLDGRAGGLEHGRAV